MRFNKKFTVCCRKHTKFYYINNILKSYIIVSFVNYLVKSEKFRKLIINLNLMLDNQNFDIIVTGDEEYSELAQYLLDNKGQVLMKLIKQKFN